MLINYLPCAVILTICPDPGCLNAEKITIPLKLIWYRYTYNAPGNTCNETVMAKW